MSGQSLAALAGRVREERNDAREIYQQLTLEYASAVAPGRVLAVVLHTARSLRRKNLDRQTRRELLEQAVRRALVEQVSRQPRWAA